MRINVYAEELTSEVEIVRKTVNQQLFYGARVFLKSPKELHYGTSDDDRSAITFWVPFTVAKGNQPQVVIDALRNMLGATIEHAQHLGDSFQFQEDHIFKEVLDKKDLEDMTSGGQ
jgi:hypothetical protein